jgi:hypothetical protein
LGSLLHSDWRMAITELFHERRDEWRYQPLLSPVYRKGPHYLSADVGVAVRVDTWDELPLAVFEVLDYGDIREDVIHRLAGFEALGVPQVWLVDSFSGSIARHLRGSLSFNETHFHHEHIQFELAEIARHRYNNGGDT